MIMMPRLAPRSTLASVLATAVVFIALNMAYFRYSTVRSRTSAYQLADGGTKQPLFNYSTPSDAAAGSGGGGGGPPTLTHTLVVARTKNENADWISQEMPDMPTAIYVADDPEAPLHPPVNRGREAMIYLTYMIDHYDNLPDVSIFVHAHRSAWHTGELLGNDAVPLLRRLRLSHITRVGYANLRCSWGPGCPDWLHPGVGGDKFKPEQGAIAAAWGELFPGYPVPATLASPCCSQFALSRERIHDVPREALMRFREWLMTNQLGDAISGRVFEYVWQFIFMGKTQLCPAQHVCWCDMFAVCFGSADASTLARTPSNPNATADTEEARNAISSYERLQNEQWRDSGELSRLNNDAEALRQAEEAHDGKRIAELSRPPAGRQGFLSREISARQQLMQTMIEEAMDRGDRAVKLEKEAWLQASQQGQAPAAPENTPEQQKTGEQKNGEQGQPAA